MCEQDLLFCAGLVKQALTRGLSPYEISVCSSGLAHVSESTMYRMVTAGVGGLMNIELERKVGFKPRKHLSPKTSTKHAKSRNYTSFLALDQDRQGSATEMDCVEGRKNKDDQVLLTLLTRPSHLQIPLLLPEHNSTEVHIALLYLKSICSKPLFELLFSTILTDNGGEFSEEDALDELFGGNRENPHLFYCDPARSDQKARCEKNHSELRQILPKGKTPFNELDAFDVAVCASHANSNPRRSLGGKSPIEVFLLLYGEEGKDLLDTLGISQVDYQELTLKPSILDVEREKRGLPPINWI